MKRVMLSLLSLSLIAGFTSLGIQSSRAKGIDSIPSTSAQTFKHDVLLSAKPVLVDFYATWCGPCKEMGPVVESAANRYAGKINVYRVDIDKDPELASFFGVQAVPTLAVFSGGRPVTTSVGVISSRELSASINEAMNRALAQKPNKSL